MVAAAAGSIIDAVADHVALGVGEPAERHLAVAGHTEDAARRGRRGDVAGRRGVVDAAGEGESGEHQQDRDRLAHGCSS